MTSKDNIAIPRKKRDPTIISDPKIGIVYNLSTITRRFRLPGGERARYVEELLATIKGALIKMALRYRSYSALANRLKR